ncbi:hypothetical protein [Flavobacterium sp. HNIBRBA15423]|uniref:hypothetical protein n=1 Tax=Flavobacterium sp. HNIBRBA15423 TaxID=3458683 RepID=UPI004043D2EF
MKKNILFLIPILCTSLLSAQNNNYIGTYEKTIKANKGEVFKYELNINADSTFTFHFFRNIGQAISVDENSYGRGTWKVVKNILCFYTNKEKDIDEKYSLSFTNTTGRFDHKNKSLFRFYRSNISWLEKRTLTKID